MILPPSGRTTDDLVGAPQVCGIAGAPRRRALLTWHTTEAVRAAVAPLASEGARPADRIEALRLRLALKGLDPPDDAATQVRTPPPRPAQRNAPPVCRTGGDPDAARPL